jgi:hypothetical protein
MNDYNENDDIEGGLMDYRGGDLTVVDLDGKFGVTLSFCVNITNDAIHKKGLSIFPGEWCAKFDPQHIVDSNWGYNYDIIKGSPKWIKPTTLYFEIVATSTLTVNDVAEDIEYDSLEDGVYEGSPGDFWVIPVSAFS